MSRMLVFAAIGLIMFSAAAGLSWYLQFSKHQEDAAKGEDEKEKDKAKKGKDKDSVDRPLVRAPLSPEADRLTTMAATLQTQQQALKTREQQLATREKQLDLIHDEIKKEHKKLEGVRKQVDAELQLVQERLELLEKRSAQVSKDRQDSLAQIEESKRLTLELSGTESKNVSKIAAMYNNMDPDTAAMVIKQMVDKGRLDTAVTTLAAMRDRQAASLLNAISNQDPDIASQLLDRMKYLKTPATTPK